MSDTLSYPLADRITNLDAPKFVDRDITIPDSAKQGAIHALTDGKTHYTNRPGIVPLREWVAKHLNLNHQYALNIDKDEVTITCGIEEALFACVMVLAETGILVLGDASHLHGASQLKGVPLVYSADDLQAGMMIVLTTQDDPAKIDAVLSHQHINDCWIVWDGSVGESDLHPAQRDVLASRTVTVNHFEEKLAGWRIGYMAGSEKANQLRAFKQSMTICSPSISQWAVNAFVGDES